MKFKLSELLAIYKPEQLNDFLKEHINTDLEDNNLLFENISDNWTCVGDTKYNLSAINMLKDSGKGLIERITNGIDAVLEKEKEKNGLDSPKTAEDIVKVAFPHYYENKQNIKNHYIIFDVLVVVESFYYFFPNEKSIRKILNL